MFPYRLRNPAYGRKLSSWRDPKDKDKEFHRGGPVQVAIEKDLVLHCETFLDAWNTEIASESTDDNKAAGVAFRRFKQLFASSKLDLLHTFSPPRCDREAYSQLIYTACFSLLKQAFQNFVDDDQEEEENGNNFERACHAVFCLYSLYETNPLPEGVDNPRELVPVGLLSAENSRIFYRRAFRQRIRIDRPHYSMLLQLKERAAAKLAETTTTRSCHLAQDILEIIDRLLPKLCLSEYTGPVGLEALAGSAEYPYLPPSYEAPVPAKTPRISSGQLDEHEARSNDGPASLPLTDLAESLKAYQQVVADIQVSASVGRASANATTGRIRSALEPILTSHSNWSEAYATHLSSRGANEGGAQGERFSGPNMNDSSSSYVRILPVRSNKKSSEPQSVSWHQSVPSSSNPHARKPEVLLPGDTPIQLQRALESCFSELYQSGAIPDDSSLSMPPPPAGRNGQPPLLAAADDMSSIGHGGVSAAGRPNVAKAPSGSSVTHGHRQMNIPRVASIPVKKETRRLPNGASFLSFAADETGDTKTIDDDFEGEFSDVSDDDDEDDELEDEVSVATSAVGQTAIKKLLSFAGQSHKSDARRGNRARSQTTKRQANATEHTGQDDLSTATSIDHGKVALENLLANAQFAGGKEESSPDQIQPEPDSSAGRPNKRKRRNSNGNRNLETKGGWRKIAPRRTKASVVKTDPDDTSMSLAPSVATSVAPGRDALSALLTSAARETETEQLQEPLDKQEGIEQEEEVDDHSNMTESLIDQGAKSLENLLAKGDFD